MPRLSPFSGLHLEGPFINRSKKGAHKELHVQDEGTLTKEKILSTYTTLSNVKHNISIVTLAPELPGSDDIIPWLVDKEVVVSLGHSLSDLETAERAIKNGASLITHLFNAMLPVRGRERTLFILLFYLFFSLSFIIVIPV